MFVLWLCLRWELGSVKWDIKFMGVAETYVSWLCYTPLYVHGQKQSTALQFCVKLEQESISPLIPYAERSLECVNVSEFVCSL